MNRFRRPLPASPGPAATALALTALAVLTAGCSSTAYAPRVELPQVKLQWPFPPNPPKLTFVRSLTGFSARASAGRALRAVAFGEERADLSAFVLPVAVAVGADGRIAVADMGRRCVHLYLPDSSRPGATGGAQASREPAGASGRYLQLTGEAKAPIVSPIGLAFDDASRLYLTDSAGRVLAFGAQGELLWSSRTAGETPWQRPTGVAWSPQTKLLYVVDTLAHRIFALHPDGTLALSFGGRGESAGNFNFPTHLFRSVSGGVATLFVADTLNFRVSAFDEGGASLGTFGRHGDGSGDLAMPKGLAADQDGVIYVADSVFDNVQLFDQGGRFLLTLGRRGTAPGEFWLPSGVFVSAAGELYVADTYNRRVQVFRIQEDYVASGI